VERGRVRDKWLAQEHNTMFPAGLEARLIETVGYPTRLALWLFWVTSYCYSTVQINVVVVVVKQKRSAKNK